MSSSSSSTQDEKRSKNKDEDEEDQIGMDTEFVEEEEDDRTDSSSSHSEIVSLDRNQGQDQEKSVGHNHGQSQPSSTLPPSVGPPPNGGLVAWLQVFSGFFLLVNSWGIINTFGAYETYYQNDLLSKESPSTISWIGSIQGFFVIAAAIVFGRMIDAGYAKYLVYAGTFLVTFGMMMTSISSEFYQLFLAQGVVTGVGCCCLFMAGIGVVASYFSTKRAFAIGIVASGSSLGGVFYPIMVRKLIDEVGFPWATRIVAFTILGLCAIPCVFLKVRLPPRKSGPLIDYPSLRDRSFIFYTIACFFGFMGQYIPIFYIQSYSLKVGVDPNLAFYITSILNAGSILGRILPSFIADKTGPINMLLPCTAACAILCFAWIAITESGGIIAYSILFGFFSGTFVSLPAACVASMTPDLGIVGTRMGMLFFVCGFGILIGAPIGGALVNRDDGNYIFAQLFAGICMAISAVFMLIARGSLAGFGLRTKC